MALPEDAEHARTLAVHEAIAYMADWVSRPEKIATYRSMVQILGLGTSHTVW